MKTTLIKTRELIEAERLMTLAHAASKTPFESPGYAYAMAGESLEVRALSIDGLVTKLQTCMLERNHACYFVTWTNIGSIAGCSSHSEGDALAELQQRYK